MQNGPGENLPARFIFRAERIVGSARSTELDDGKGERGKGMIAVN